MIWIHHLEYHNTVGIKTRSLQVLKRLVQQTRKASVQIARSRLMLSMCNDVYVDVEGVDNLDSIGVRNSPNIEIKSLAI